MVEIYAYLSIYLWWVIISGYKQEVTSQCKPAATTSGRRQHHRLLVGLLLRFWRSIETNSSRLATTLVYRVFTTTTSSTTGRGCWCSGPPFPSLSLRHSPFTPVSNLCRMHSVYAVAVQTLTAAKINTKYSSDLASIMLSVQENLTKIIDVFFQRFHNFSIPVWAD